MTVTLLPCPFCGEAPDFERLGTHRASCIVACGYCGARHESGDVGDMSGLSWNQRADLPPVEPSEADVERVGAQLRDIAEDGGEYDDGTWRLRSEAFKAVARAAIAAGLDPSLLLAADAAARGGK